MNQSRSQFARGIRRRALWLFLLLWLSACSLSVRPVESIPTVDPNATRETKALFMNLWIQARSGHTLFGHQDTMVRGVGWSGYTGRSDVHDAVGSYPAVYGWDVSQIELGEDGNVDGVSFDDVRTGIIDAYQRGGVNTVSWHMFNPVTGGNFYDLDGRPVEKILFDASYLAQYRQWLDRFADFALSLRSGPTPWNPDDHLVPIVFRPFHEHNAGQFWWGHGHATEVEYRALWRFTVQYLRDERGVHNLLYAISPDARVMPRASFISGSYASYSAFKSAYLYGYPGDPYVDIFGLDDYSDPRQNRQTGMQESMRYLTQLANERSDLKIPAMTETGFDTVPPDSWWTTFLLPSIRGARGSSAEQMAWVLMWTNGDEAHFNVPYNRDDSSDDFRAFAASRFIWFQDDITVNMYQWPPD